jgi:hypothetical protein
MKDIDRYLLITGLFLVAGFICSTGVNYSTEFLHQVEYLPFGLVACGIAIGVMVIKFTRNKSTNN